MRRVLRELVDINRITFYVINLSQPFQPTVSADVLETYIALEEKIAEAEKDSPAMLLQQKQEQIQQLSIRIEEQRELVDQLTTAA